MTRSASHAFRHVLVASLALGAVHQTAAWPGIQAVFHAFLVLGAAPEFHSPLVGALWAAAAGWVLEGTLRLYPHMGGTPLADMLTCLGVGWTLLQWPPSSLRLYWIRMAAFSGAHALLVHGLVRVTAGSHAWGSGPVWTFLLVPVWATLAFKLHQPHPRE